MSGSYPSVFHLEKIGWCWRAVGLYSGMILKGRKKTIKMNKEYISMLSAGLGSEEQFGVMECGEVLELRIYHLKN